MKSGRLSDKVVVGGQPSADDLAKLREQGIMTVVNLRTEGEANQPLSPSEEATLAQNMGLSYQHVPVSLAALDSKQVDDVRAAIRNAQGPVYVHCGAGQWACAIADFVAAYNFGRRLKTLKGLTPYEFICQCWTREPGRFTLSPLHQMPGLNI